MAGNGADKSGDSFLFILVARFLKRKPTHSTCRKSLIQVQTLGSTSDDLYMTRSQNDVGAANAALSVFVFF